jgi:hypothetical protein
MRRNAYSGGLFILALGLLATACGGGGGGTYYLDLTFPSQADIERTATVEIYAITPGADGNCDDLVSGAIEPFDAGVVEDTAVMEGANPAELPELEGLGKGSLLFFARVKDDQHDIFLRGCRSVEVGDVEDVSIDLEAV